MSNRIDISNELTLAFFKEKSMHKGKVLIFRDDKGKQTELKIVRLNRSKRICITEPVKLYTEDEINDMPREDAERIIQGE